MRARKILILNRKYSISLQYQSKTQNNSLPVFVLVETKYYFEGSTPRVSKKVIQKYKQAPTAEFRVDPVKCIT